MLRALALVSLGATAAAPLAAAQGTFIAQSGLLVVEIESAFASGAWNQSTSTPGWLTDGYFRWDGPNLFNQPGAQGIFSFDFEVEEAGTWILRLRNRHENPDPTEENDVWIRMDGGPWIKVFSNMAGSVGAWTWESRFDLSHNNQPQASYNLDVGTHRIQFSGRSFGFKMDRFHLHRPGNPGATDPNQEESLRRVGTNFCPASTNSSGNVARLSAVGSPRVEQNDLVLTASSLPLGSSGYFLVSRDQGLISAPAGSSGNLCLVGDVGRYADSVTQANAAGTISLRADLTDIPQPTGGAAAMAGETWNFQLWYRDAGPSGATSNFSRALELTFI